MSQASPDGAPLLAPASSAGASGPVECLGRTFESEDARRRWYLERLREKLPELRKRPDFPVGEDEAILRMSDPPWHTACPNPFLGEFIEHSGRPYEPGEPYHREPFSVDVSEGKANPLYKAHGYHTKVPHLAIVPSILHYTKPGDIVLDGYCGSGMTGVAAQWCGTAPAEYRREVEARWKAEGRDPPDWGIRRAVLGDLSPAATFIAAGYNIPFEADAFARAGRNLLDEAEAEIGWMYETRHTDGTTARINYTVWSEVFACPDCSGEVVFVEEALDPATKRVRSAFPCPHCRAALTKRRLDRLHDSVFDTALGRPVRLPRRKPVLINYSVEGRKHEKTPDEEDRAVLRRIEAMDVPAEIPVDRMMHAPEEEEGWGDEWRPGVAAFSHVHHLFVPRAAHAVSAMWHRFRIGEGRVDRAVLFLVEQAIAGISVQNRYGPLHYSQVNRYMSGRIRTMSQHAECSPWYILDGKLARLSKAFSPMRSISGAAAITTGDCARIPAPSASFDYVFTDPPFGYNLAYGELNFLTEAFHRVFTNRRPEAIVSRTQEKGLDEYRRLMRDGFAEYCRVLKPGRWMTVVFHNSMNAIWNAIQEAISDAGFVIADVRILDKQQGTFNQVLAAGAVERDLVISAYRPNEGLEERFQPIAGTESGVWDFVRAHLRQLPVAVRSGGVVEVLATRQRHVLFDRMVAFHVGRGVLVPMSASEFYAGLVRRYPERDAMFFLPDQVVEYDRKRLLAGEVRQPTLFVVNEDTAIQWLRRELRAKPRTFQQLHPHFIKAMAAWSKHESVIELSLLLEENFLPYDGEGPVPGPIHGYLSNRHRELRNLSKTHSDLRRKAKNRWYVPDPNKEADLEKVRDRALLREFQKYRDPQLRRLRVFRTEAIRAGFRQAWRDRNYDAILTVAEKIPDNILHEDPQLLMSYDHAQTRKDQQR